jgi:hypothetical protein
MEKVSHFLLDSIILKMPVTASLCSFSYCAASRECKKEAAGQGLRGERVCVLCLFIFTFQSQFKLFCFLLLKEEREV